MIIVTCMLVYFFSFTWGYWKIEEMYSNNNSKCLKVLLFQSNIVSLEITVGN